MAPPWPVHVALLVQLLFRLHIHMSKPTIETYRHLRHRLVLRMMHLRPVQSDPPSLVQVFVLLAIYLLCEPRHFQHPLHPRTPLLYDHQSHLRKLMNSIMISTMTRIMTTPTTRDHIHHQIAQTSHPVVDPGDRRNTLASSAQSDLPGRQISRFIFARTPVLNVSNSFHSFHVPLSYKLPISRTSF